MTKEELVLFQRDIYSKITSITDSQESLDVINYLDLIITYLKSKSIVVQNVAITTTNAVNPNQARLNVHDVAKAVASAQSGKNVGVHNN